MPKTLIFTPEGKPDKIYNDHYETWKWSDNYPVYLQGWSSWEDGWYHSVAYPRGRVVEKMWEHEIPKEAKAYVLLII